MGRKLKKKKLRSLFFPPKNPSLARKVSIRTPGEFRKSIRTLKKGGLRLEEKRALVLAQNRARLQLRRKNLSDKERAQFKEIANTKLPPFKQRKKPRRGVI